MAYRQHSTDVEIATRDGTLTLRVHYGVTDGVAARSHCHPDDQAPAEPDEVNIERVEAPDGGDVTLLLWEPASLIVRLQRAAAADAAERKRERRPA